MRKKLLITGASGFVGSHLVQEASLQQFEVHAAVRKSSSTTDIVNFVDQFVYPAWDNAEDLYTFLASESYDYIIHAAALTKSKSEDQMYNVNVGYTKNLLSAISRLVNKPSRIIFVSSLAAIGPIAFANDAFIEDDSPYNPVTVYGRSKRDAELMIKQDFSQLPITIIRPTAVYGPREKDLFILFETLNKGFELYIGKKPQALSFVYVEDLVAVLLNALSVINPKFAYNISDGNVYSKYSMADIFKKLYKRRFIKLHVPYRIVAFVAVVMQKLYNNSVKTPVIYPERLNELTAENWSCNINAAKNDLSFNPNYNLEKGLEKTVEWYKTNKWL